MCESRRKSYQTETRGTLGKTKGKIRCVIIPASPHHKIISTLAHASTETLMAPLKQTRLSGRDVTSTVDVTRPDNSAKYQQLVLVRSDIIRFSDLLKPRVISRWTERDQLYLNPVPQRLSSDVVFLRGPFSGLCCPRHTVHASTQRDLSNPLCCYASVR